MNGYIRYERHTLIGCFIEEQRRGGRRRNNWASTQMREAHAVIANLTVRSLIAARVVMARMRNGAQHKRHDQQRETSAQPARRNSVRTEQWHVAARQQRFA